MTVWLEARNLHKAYRLPRGQRLQALGGVSLRIRRGESLALVGESGCGKSTLGRALIGLEPIDSGSIHVAGDDMAALPPRRRQALRGRMQMVFQNVHAALNPRRVIGASIAEPLRIHGVEKSAIDARVMRLLDLVGLSAEAADRYPHEFSGGQRQRINIARAIALEPDLLVADEPVSALDVSVQAQIVNLFRDLQERTGLTCLFISHDLAIVRQMADRLAVMYLGRIVEEGDGLTVLTAPAHPYTRALLDAVPRADCPLPPPLGGEVPSPIAPPPGCHFHPRCPFVQPLCREVAPVLTGKVDGRQVACHFPLSQG